MIRDPLGVVDKAAGPPVRISQDPVTDQQAAGRRQDAAANWKARAGLAMLLPVVLVAALGPWITPFSFDELGTGALLEGPSWRHLLGTDLHGRDVLSRLIIGARPALGVPVAIAAVTLAIGLPLGLLVGYRPGWVDEIVMRVVDMILSMPWILVALALASVRGPGINTVIVALAVVFVAPVIRVTRSSVRSVASKEYVDGARALGEGGLSISTRYIFRNAYFPVLVLLTSQLGYSILAESAMSYLGLGVQSPNTSWGLELAMGRDYMAIAPHLVIAPGVFIAWAVLAFNFLGDGMGDKLDDGGWGLR